MASSSSRIVGIDLGSEAIRAVEVEAHGRGAGKVTAWREIAVPPGVIDSGEVVDVAATAVLLRKLWAGSAFRSTTVVLGIGNPRVLVREVTVPCGTPAEVRQGLHTQVNDLLTVPVADAILDFYPVSEAIENGAPVLRGLLVAAVKDAVATNIDAARLAGLTTVDVDLIPFALVRLHAALLASGTAALIEVGARTTTVVVTDRAVPQFVRIIPSGGADITAALTDTLGVAPAQADTLKRSIGLLAPSRPSLRLGVADDSANAAAGVIADVCGELLEGIRNTLRYVATAHPDSPPTRLVVTGGGAALPGFLDAVQEITRLPGILADPFAAVTVSAKLRRVPPTGTVSAAPSPSLAVALGLALGYPAGRAA